MVAEREDCNEDGTFCIKTYGPKPQRLCHLTPNDGEWENDFAPRVDDAWVYNDQADDFAPAGGHYVSIVCDGDSVMDRRYSSSDCTGAPIAERNLTVPTDGEIPPYR